MKNFLILLLIESFSHCSFSQIPVQNVSRDHDQLPLKEPFKKQVNTREVTYTPREEQEYSWVFSSWQFTGADHHLSYDPVTCLIATDTVLFSGVKAFLTVNAYDSVLAILSPDLITFPSYQTFYVWDGTDWNYNHRYSYTFYPQGYFHTYVALTYNASSQQWDTTYAWNRIRTFDTDDNPIELIRELYNLTTHQYENDYKQIFQYYNPGYVSGFDFYDWISNQFELTFRITDQAYNYYNSSIDYQLNYSLQQNWTGSAWIDAFQTSTTYDSNNSQFFLTQLWTGSVWENFGKYGFIYDSYGNEIEYYDSSWNGTFYDLNYVDKFLLTYGTNDELIENIYQYADAFTPLENFSKMNFSDFIICNPATSAQEIVNAADFTVFPNPSQGLFTLFWKELTKDDHQLTVMDLFGRIVLTDRVSGVSGTKQIFLPGISDGNYLLVINDGEQKFIQQIEKLNE